MGKKQDTLFSLYLPLHASKRFIEGHKLEFITTIVLYIPSCLCILLHSSFWCLSHKWGNFRVIHKVFGNRLLLGLKRPGELKGSMSSVVIFRDNVGQFYSKAFAGVNFQSLTTRNHPVEETEREKDKEKERDV